MNWKPYKEVRKNIKNGDTFATASRSLFSVLIRFFTRSSVSHVGVFIVIKNRIFIAEALEGQGVRFMLASERFKNTKFLHYRGGKIDEDKVFDTLGSKYDLIGALASPFVNTKSKERFCSEAVAYWLGLNFSHLKRGVIPSDIISKLKEV